MWWIHQFMQVQGEATVMPHLPPKSNLQRSHMRREKIMNDDEKYEAAKKKDRERKKEARALFKFYLKW